MSIEDIATFGIGAVLGYYVVSHYMKSRQVL